MRLALVEVALLRLVVFNEEPLTRISDLYHRVLTAEVAGGRDVSIGAESRVTRFKLFR